MDRFIGNGIIKSPYPATWPLLCIYRRGAERLDRRATDVYLSKLLQAGGTHTATGDGSLKPVVASIGPQYRTAGSFASPGTTTTRCYALLASKPPTASCATDLGEKRRA